MAKNNVSNRGKVVNTNVSVRSISNGFIVRETKEYDNGRWNEKETFSKTNPIKIVDKPVVKKK